MISPPALRDYEAFGQLVRERRLALGLSQEALAAAALGNPDRKSFVSAIENNRLTKITSNTAKKLSGPLGLAREDVPASMRWPSANGPTPTEERLSALEARQKVTPASIENRAIARFLNAQMSAVLRKSMSEVFRGRLAGGLDLLQVWTGRPFSLQSLLICYALSLLYVVFAGLWSFVQGDIAIGAVKIFQTLEWANSGLRLILPLSGILILALGVAACWYLVLPFGVRPLSGKETAGRLACVAMVAGLACGVVAYLGTPTLTAAVMFTVPSCAGIAMLPPRAAALYGAAGGIMFGLVAAVSSGLADETPLAFMISLSEGFIIGAIVGFCACLASSLIARRMSHLRAGQLAAAGGGVGVGALISVFGILVAENYAAVSGPTLGRFSVSWVALPLANATLDYVSLGVSHALGLYIVAYGRRAGSILLVLVLDLAVAVALMVMSVVAIGLALRTVTLGLGIDTLSGTFLQNSAADPWGQGIWLTFMVLSTTIWTWLHFGLVVAPLAAGSVIRRALEIPAAKRLKLAREEDDFDLSVGVLVSLRVFFFYLLWVGVALLPLLVLVVYPEVMETILWLGWRLTSVLS